MFFRLSISASAAVAALSVGYYLVIVQPRNLDRSFEALQVERCKTAGIERIRNAENYLKNSAGLIGGFEIRWNPRLNRCFMKSTFLSTPTTGETRAERSILDLNTNEILISEDKGASEQESESFREEYRRYFGGPGKQGPA